MNFVIGFKAVVIGEVVIEDCANEAEARRYFEKTYEGKAFRIEKLIHDADDLDDFESHITLAGVNEIPVEAAS